MMHGESEGRMSGETTTGEDGPNLFFKYGDNDLPAYRDAGGFMIVTGSGERPVTDLFKFVHEATPITRAEFEELKAHHAAMKAAKAS